MPALRELIARFTVAWDGQAALTNGSRAVNNAKLGLDRAAASATKFGAAMTAAAVRGKATGATNVTGSLGAASVASLATGNKSVSGQQISQSLKAPNPSGWQRFGAAVAGVRGQIAAMASAPGIFDRLAGSWGRLFAVASVAYVAKNALGGLTHEAKELTFAARKLGIAVDELDRIQDTASMVEVSSQAVQTGVKYLLNNVGMASRGGKEAQTALKALGISYETVGGKLPPVTALFRQAVAGMQAIDDPTKRAGLAMKVFGEQGLELMPLLSQTPEQLDEIGARLDALGGGLDKRFRLNVEKLTESQLDLNYALLSLKTKVLAGLVPVLTSWAHKSAQAAVALQNLNKGGAAGRLAVIALSAVVLSRVPAMTAAVLTFARAWALPLLGIAAVGLVVEDLWAAFDGGQSVFGSEVVPAIIQGLDDMKAAFTLLATDVKGLFSVLYASIQDGWKNTLTSIATGGLAGLVTGGPASTNVDKAKASWATARTAAVAGTAKPSDDLQAVRAYNARLEFAAQKGRAVEAVQAAKAWKESGGRMGVTVDAAGKPMAPAKTITLADHTVINMNVHGSTADQAKQVADRAAKLTAISHRAQQAALLQDVE